MKKQLRKTISRGDVASGSRCSFLTRFRSSLWRAVAWRDSSAAVRTCSFCNSVRRSAFTSANGCFRRRIVSIQPEDRECVFDLDQAAHLPGLHGQRRLHNLRWQFVAVHGLVVAHIHAEVVLGEFFRQQSKFLVTLRRLGLAQMHLPRVCGLRSITSGLAFCGGRMEMLCMLNDSGC